MTRNTHHFGLCLSLCTAKVNGSVFPQESNGLLSLHCTHMTLLSITDDWVQGNGRVHVYMQLSLELQAFELITFVSI